MTGILMRFGISYQIRMIRCNLTYYLPRLSLLYGLDLFVKNSRSFSWLFVDEPEMNLHPARQKDVVTRLYELARVDVHITMSTHSDYLVKSLINLMLADRLAQGRARDLLPINV